MPSITLSTGKETYPNILYVDELGDDTNPGTKDAPLRALRTALTKAVNKTIIVLGKGTFAIENNQKSAMGRSIIFSLNKNIIIVGQGKDTIINCYMNYTNGGAVVFSGDALHILVNLTLQVKATLGVNPTLMMDVRRSAYGVILENVALDIRTTIPDFMYLTVASRALFKNVYVLGTLKMHDWETQYKSTIDVDTVTTSSYTSIGVYRMLGTTVNETYDTNMTVGSFSKLFSPFMHAIKSGDYYFDLIDGQFKSISLDEFENNGSHIDDLKENTDMILSLLQTTSFGIVSKNKPIQYVIEE